MILFSLRLAGNRLTSPFQPVNRLVLIQDMIVQSQSNPFCPPSCLIRLVERGLLGIPPLKQFMLELFLFMYWLMTIFCYFVFSPSACCLIGSNCDNILVLENLTNHYISLLHRSRHSSMKSSLLFPSLLTFPCDLLCSISFS